MVGAGECVVLDLSSVGVGGVEEDAVEVGVLLDEPRQPAGVEAERVLPDEYLGVGLVGRRFRWWGCPAPG